MPEYLLSVHTVEGQAQPTTEEMAKAYKDVDSFNIELQAEGAWVFAGLARRAADTYVMASHEKIGAVSGFSVLPLAEVAGVSTDADADDPTVARLRTAGVSMLMV